MIEPNLIEGVLSSLFDFLNKKIVISPADKAKFDFLIKGENESKVGIEVKGQNITTKALANIEKAISTYPEIDEFFLITPETPAKDQLDVFNSFFRNSKTPVHWKGIYEYLQNQNLDFKVTEDIRDSLLNLQLATLTSKYDLYKKDHIGSNLGYDQLAQNLKTNIENVSQGKIDKFDIRFGLRRQFSDKTISKLENDAEAISNFLNFGAKYDDAIIILTDIKNFSSIVTAADPEELNELMGKYYTNTRELVFKYGGVLDKFIGDAVLAIFNYPEKNEDTYKKAIKFCAELILMGENLLNDFQKKLDQEIETGTRVGISSGPIYAINISQEDIEVTFIGDKINFAARLEKNCEVNGILMSNRFYNKLKDYNSDFVSEFELSEIKIDPKDAKGQIGSTTAWQVLRNKMEIIIK